ncbi:hypothetical protein SDC9_101879 [bioreactor metagenome]|uniref:Uncharacterized protein n=1 Tax=bioreactor metagenome TaxID=1076179 RepID=A0A645B001_9ZZZZ
MQNGGRKIQRLNIDHRTGFPIDLLERVDLGGNRDLTEMRFTADLRDAFMVVDQLDLFCFYRFSEICRSLFFQVGNILFKVKVSDKISFTFM